MLTPVGEMTKAETRAYARRLGLTTADKPESVEICFVPGRRLRRACSSGTFRPTRRRSRPARW